MTSNKDLLNKAQSVAVNVSLMRIHLWEAKCSRDVSVKPTAVEVAVEIGTELLKGETENLLPFGCKFTLVGTDKNVQKQVFEIIVSFCVVYEIKDKYKPTDDETKAFGLTNAIFNAWPYVREMVQNLIVRMDLPAFVLPTITIGQLAKMGESPEPLSVQDICESTRKSKPDINQG
ncbi:MAG: hypothetical protein ABSF52_01340 [Syntrophobacteraceae bacterium]|jgi:preprotein translocase subunit SecB